MSRKETIDEIISDAAFMQWWKQNISNGNIHKMLTLANCYRRPYGKDQKPDPVPHINSEQNGGMKAWDKLSYLLTSLPYNEYSGPLEEQDEFIGYQRDIISELRANK